MSNEVIINMQNTNALIAMAQVSQNSNNPFSVFCEYIKQCIFVNPSNVTSIQEISDSLIEMFGLEMPQNVLLKCLADIQNDNLIKLEKHQIYRTGIYNTEEFEQQKRAFKQTEEAIVQELIKYVSKYWKDWSYEYAREQLVNVLDGNNWAYDIFMHKKVDNTANNTDYIGEDEVLFSDSFFVGKFIQGILDEDSIYKNYLEDVCNGLMICAGVYQLPTNGEKVSFSIIKDTCFFFDTRLLLRFLGCANEAAVQATKELVDLIQNQGGKIYYFPHTLEEMNNAFDEAIKSLKNGFPPRDEEMRVFASAINNRETILTAKKASLKNELSTSKICLRPLGTYSEKERIKVGFDKKDFESYMLSQLKWDAKVIENDATSIWETHMIRKGDYSDYCGTKKRLAVFVTTNPVLVSTSLKYKEDHRSIKTISGWKNNRLPVISDIRMTCRIWSPSKDGKRLPLLHLAANAMAAQKPTQRYINTIRDLVKGLETYAPEYSEISLPAFFDDSVTDAILNETSGEIAKLDIGSFANSISELAEWKAKEQEDITKQVEEQLDKATSLYNEQTKIIIDGAIEQNVDKMGFPGVVLKLVLAWPIVATLLFTFVSAIVSKMIENWSLLFIGTIPMIIALVQHIFSSKFIEKKVIKKLLPWAGGKYEKRIEQKLRKSEIPYKDEIIKQVQERTKLLVKCRELL